MSYPGVYRTVTNPLMFNMGRRVGPTSPLQPVLPMPFSDEGVDARLELALTEHWNATLDAYAVNGLQGTEPLIFNASRRYTDNNREPAIGWRATVGTSHLRFGGSMITGNLANDGTPGVNYKVAGADVTLRLDDLLRFYFEYAIREDDSRFIAGRQNYTYGIVAELEGRLTSHLSLLARYDTLEHRHTQFGDVSQERFTYGLNVTLPGGSWLAIHHEHWIFDDTLDVDVIGLRWTATF
jgi:hypothetical protein